MGNRSERAGEAVGKSALIHSCADRGCGYVPFSEAESENGAEQCRQRVMEPGERLEQFDPQVAQIIMVPRVVRG